MKLLPVFATFALSAGCASGGAQVIQFDGERALGYVRTQMEFGPRVPNTDGHRRTGDWILEQLRQKVDTVEVQAFTHVTLDDDTLQLRNFIGRIMPEMSERVLLLAHWDTRPVSDKATNMAQRRLPVPGANDGASGVAVLLGIADELRVHPPIVGVDLLFVDGEDYGDFSAEHDVLLGSKHFAANLPEGYQPLFGVLLDMVGDANLSLPKEWNSNNRAPEVVDRVWRKANELGFGRVFRNEVGGAVTDDHIPLLDAGIRTIDIIQLPLPPYHHTPEDTIDKLSARSLAIVGSVAVALVR
jgi:hypothetical protein